MQRKASAVWPGDFNSGNGGISTASGVLVETQYCWSARSAAGWPVAASHSDSTANHSGRDTEQFNGIARAAKVGGPISSRSNARLGLNAKREA
jgi:hypothetical protein